MTQDFLKDLNPEQVKAVTQADGQMIVLAGAGSGKTRVIVHKVCYLLEKGIFPGSIVLLTFTRRAAGEMLDRVKKISERGEVNKISGMV